jgi:hypothetical protein
MKIEWIEVRLRRLKRLNGGKIDMALGLSGFARLF